MIKRKPRQRLLNKPQAQQIRDKCLKLLARREHSRQELSQKLTVGGFSQNAVEKIVAELNQEGWQSDKRFAESYARGRIRKGFGPLRIVFELKQRGIDTVDLKEIIVAMETSWLDVISQVYSKKYTLTSALTGKEWLSRTRFLQQRGFSNEAIRALFKHLQLKLT